MSKATPRPWRIYYEPDSPVIHVQAVDDSSNGELSVAIFTGDERGHNAAYAVRACNAHDALVAACEAALSLLNNIGTGKWAQTPAGDALRAALALAKGGGT